MKELSTYPEFVQLMIVWNEQGLTSAEMADALNEAGIANPRGGIFNAQAAAAHLRHHGFEINARVKLRGSLNPPKKPTPGWDFSEDNLQVRN